MGRECRDNRLWRPLYRHQQKPILPGLLQRNIQRIADQYAASQKQEQAAQAQTILKGWIAEAAKGYGTLIKPNPDGAGFSITNKAVADAYAAVDKEMGANPVSVKTILEMALLRLGKLGKKPTQNTVVVPRKIARPALNAVPRRGDNSSNFKPQFEIVAKK